ncbi:hypothetical protein NsoK4_07265 [Nitrosopumilus sp. K4]|uniref:hypothetical protein n=1 Tax=Nitrosopumilus sp. K4 TaxID=2795383 RepID=UPI001BA67D2B|nr:hypothetical protein [Nitrosopumilus sp. K4]QUC64234.1 hypothetical protein NsoK4_07265 [Nitrosopumilus sp. K4]
MNKMMLWTIVTIVAFFSGSIAVNPVAEAANPLLEEIQVTLGLIKTETDKIQTIQDDIASLETGISSETEGQIDNIEFDLADVKAETDKIQTIQDDIESVKTNTEDNTTIRFLKNSRHLSESRNDVIVSCNEVYEIKAFYLDFDDPDGDIDVRYTSFSGIAFDSISPDIESWWFDSDGLYYDPPVGVSLRAIELLSTLDVNNSIVLPPSAKIGVRTDVQSSSDPSDDFLYYGVILETLPRANCSLP